MSALTVLLLIVLADKVGMWPKPVFWELELVQQERERRKKRGAR